MLSLQRQVQHRRSHLRHFSASKPSPRWDENRSRPAWHTSPRHQTQTATAVIQSNISSLWWINRCNGPPPLPRPPPRQVDEKAPYLEILSPDQMRPPVQTRVTFDEETEAFTWKGGFQPTKRFRCARNFGGSSHRHGGRYFSGQRSKLSICTKKHLNKKQRSNNVVYLHVSSCIFVCDSGSLSCVTAPERGRWRCWSRRPFDPHEVRSPQEQKFAQLVTGVRPHQLKA